MEIENTVQKLFSAQDGVICRAVTEWSKSKFHRHNHSRGNMLFQSGYAKTICE